MSAALATLEVLSDPGIYKYINFLGNSLKEKLNELFLKKGLGYSADNVGSLVSFIFCQGCQRMRNLNDNLSQDREVFSNLHYFLLERGFMLAPTIDEPLFISYSHTEEHINKLVW